MGVRGGFVVEVKRLRIVLGRKVDHFFARDLLAAEAADDADLDVLVLEQCLSPGQAILSPATSRSTTAVARFDSVFVGVVTLSTTMKCDCHASLPTSHTT